MAKPKPGESHGDFMDRCVTTVMNDGSASSNDQAVAMCLNMWSEAQGHMGPKASAPQGDYGNVEYADPGFQADKKPRYPIDTEEHIRSAWSYINHPDNSKLYTAEQLTHIKNKIISAWKAKIDPAGPPGAKAHQPVNRAYSFLTIKSVNEDQRIIEGVASTPTPDRVGDIVDPMGAKFNLPMPLLWQHRSDQPIGQVTWAKATKDGIPFKAQIARTNEAGKLKDRLDEAWQSIKLGLVRAVSIGFNSLKHAYLKDGSGINFQEWEWLELSAVTIPANADANIMTIRSIDAALRNSIETEINTMSGDSDISTTNNSPGASGNHKPVKIMDFKTMAKKTVAEQISAFEATRQAKAARLDEIMEEAAEKGETLDEASKQEYDTLETEVKEVDDHLVRLRKLQASSAAQAKPISGETQEAGTTTRGGGVISVKPNTPPGIGMARMVIARMNAYKNNESASNVAERMWPSNPEVAMALKTAVAPGDTTTSGWASQLTPYQNLASEFVEFLRPMTLIGRIPGFRRVPFNVQLPRQTAGTSGHWVGEGKSKPLGKLQFDNIQLRWAKCAGIVTFTEELARFSNPSIEALVRDDLAKGLAQFLDEQLLDPSVQEVSNVSPAAITYNADTHAATGATYADLVSDVKGAFAVLQAANIPVSGSVWVMEPQQAVGLAMMQNPLGQPQFPGVNVDGGTLLGLPVYVSESAGAGQITLFKPGEILLADDGGFAVDISREASLHMDDSQTDSSGAEHISLWQNNLVGVRAERFINWKARRDDAVVYLTGCDYGGPATTI